MIHRGTRRLVVVINADDLRTQLERKAEALKELSEDKANHLIDGKGEALIDPGVLRAFIKVPRYKHGMRSMQAVIDMSMLAGRKHFEQAALPAPEQLDLHVDAEAFCRLVVHDTLLSSAREKIARAFHEAYRRQPQPQPARPRGMKKKRCQAPNLRFIRILRS